MIAKDQAAEIEVIFFDCWRTLFWSAEGRDVGTVLSGLIGVKLDRDFIKTFEQCFMTRPHRDLRVPAKALIMACGRPVTPGLVEAIEQNLRVALTSHRSYPDTLVALEALRPKYRLVLLTNSHLVAFEHLRQTFKLDDYFDILLPSYEVGHIKPDPEIFETALARVGVAAHQALMVGDTPQDDIEPAQKLGLHTQLLDRENRYPDYADRITVLAPLLERLL